MWWDTTDWEIPSDSSRSQAHRPGSWLPTREQQDSPRAFRSSRICRRFPSDSALKARTRGSLLPYFSISTFIDIYRLVVKGFFRAEKEPLAGVLVRRLVAVGPEGRL